MKIIRGNYQDIKNTLPITLTIGNFDGVHQGHQLLIDSIKKYHDTKAAIMTFSPHPQAVFKNNNNPFLTLMTIQDKIDFFKKEQIDYLFIVNFSLDFSRLNKEEFIIHLKRLNVKRIIVGENFKFAKTGSGSINDLKNEFLVEIIPSLILADKVVSTTLIKENLSKANLKPVKTLLDRNYQFKGLVISGNKIGRTLGFPTANLKTFNYFLPKSGVYEVNVFLRDKEYQGLLSIGTNPTVSNDDLIKVEVYIKDFSDEIYGEELTIEVVRFLRDEKKFSSKEELVKQMKNDLTLI